MKKLFTLIAIIAIATATLGTGITPASALDSSYWSSDPGAVSRSSDQVRMTVRTRPAYPFERAWGKNLSVRGDRTYVIGFDAEAQSYTSTGRVTISLRLHKATAPWTRVSPERTITLDAAKRRYEVRLPATADQSSATVSVWVGHTAARYTFSNISVTALSGSNGDDYDYGCVEGDSEQVYGFDSKWWSNQNGIDKNRTVIHHDVWGLPTNPWEIAWGRDLSVNNGSRYVLSFDAEADSYTNNKRVPVSVRIYQNRSPWARYSEEKTIELDGTRRHYEVALTANRTDSRSVIALYSGHARADYRFWNVRLSVNPDNGVNCNDWEDDDWNDDYWEDDTWNDDWDNDDGSWTIGNEWWTRRAGDLDRGSRTLVFTNWNRPANAYSTAWGKNINVRDGRDYRLEFDARAKRQSGSGNLPVSVRLYRNYSPWTKISEERTVYLDEEWQHFDIRLSANDDEPNAAVAAWLGHEAGKYQFKNIRFQLD